MRHLLLSLTISAALTTCAEAQVPSAIDCAKALSTVEMNYCAEQDYKRADATLNAAYQKLLRKVQESGGEAPYDAASWEKALKAAQRAWVAFRDADCKGLVPMEWSGGSGTTVAVLSCMTELTRERTKTLTERYGER